MAMLLPDTVLLLILCITVSSFLTDISCLYTDSSNNDEFSITSYDSLSVHGDYSPPSPPPPPPLPPHPPSLSCEEDLGGVGSLDTSCNVNNSIAFEKDIYLAGNGSLHVLPGVALTCPFIGCSISVNVSGDFTLGQFGTVSAGSVSVYASTASFFVNSVVNATGLAGKPPAGTSGAPSGMHGSGGGYGGRGASCVTDNTKLPEDVWGGDAYSWSSLERPLSYGSKGGTTSEVENYGGGGGGRIRVEVENSIEIRGSLLADGGNTGLKGGGGSGGSIYIKAQRMTGSGRISSIGGNGFAGGGGGRVSIDVFSRRDNTDIFVHGGRSFGCLENSGAAGTFYDAVPRRLVVNNHNLSTNTDTLLMEFPKQKLWTNIYIQNHAKASVPLYWSRVQVRGQIQLSCGAVLSFGLPHFTSSDFELMAEELLMSDSVVKIYGALRMFVKMHLMWNSKMLINGGSEAIVATSLIEASNLLVLKESSIISSSADLGVHGQGFLNLSGPGDIIEAQRLVLSLFYSINVGPGATLRGPLKNPQINDTRTPRLHCEDQECPRELIHPPEDCNVNSSLSFTLQICRVEDVIVEGTMLGSVVYFHWVRTLVVRAAGAISASGLGCTGGVGRGQVLKNGLGSGGGHGGKGGKGYYDGSFIEGGITYGNPNLPCELGSGSGNDSLAGVTAGGGIIVIGSLEHSLSSLSVYGSLTADGESSREDLKNQDETFTSSICHGGGSGGTILLFVSTFVQANSSILSADGGNGCSRGGGGGGGGRIHFHWSNIPTGDDYVAIATVEGSSRTRGGSGRGRGHAGENGTVTGKACPRGLYGIFCEECPVGTFKNVTGSDRALCHGCMSYELPHRAAYVKVRGGVTESHCPYKCNSDRYHMPHCYTTLEELVYTFGGPWFFGFSLLGLLLLLALVLSVARMKYSSGDESTAPAPPRRGSHSFPFLESLNEVMETNRAEESESHVHRMYFMGPNTFGEPWHLPHSPPKQVIEIVYEDAFNKFVDEINALAAYQWWEGSVYTVVSVLAYPLAWSWLQLCRQRKLQQLREFVRSEYDHSCLRSCRSRALYEGIKVAANTDLMLAYVDFFLGGDETRNDLPPRLDQRFPLSIIFGGDGSYMAPFTLHNDNIITTLMSQSVPPTIWYRLVAGLNAQLRLVHRGHLKITFGRVSSWLETHANPTLGTYGVQLDLAWFQPTTSGYWQFGLVVCAIQNEVEVLPAYSLTREQSRLREVHRWDTVDRITTNELLLTRKRIFGGILTAQILQTYKMKRAISYPFSFIVYNTKPVGHQDLVGLFICMLLLGDFSLVLLTLLQLYSRSVLDFLLVLCILPLALLLPFPAGINALFSHGAKTLAGHARVYALWNIMSFVNIAIAFLCGYLHFQSRTDKKHSSFQSWNLSMDESEWWILPCGLLVCKLVQARLIDYHVANQEVQDHSLYSSDPDVFWHS